MDNFVFQLLQKIAVLRQQVQGLKPDYILEEGTWDFYPTNVKENKVICETVESLPISKHNMILDLGCGVSPILWKLDRLGYTNLHGIEKQRDLFRLADKAFSDYDNVHIYQDDFREPSKKGIITLNQSDVTIVYGLASDEKLREEIYRKLHVYLKKGSFLINFFEDVNFEGFIKLDEGLYIVD